jgi:hypothetical protein
MRNLARIANLGMKSRESGGILRELLGEKLHGDNLTELEILGAINFAHASPARQRHNTVTFRKDLPGREPATAKRI